MKDLIEGFIGAVVITCLPLAVAYIARRWDKKEERKQSTGEVFLRHLENMLLDRFNKE